MADDFSNLSFEAALKRLETIGAWLFGAVFVILSLAVAVEVTMRKEERDSKTISRSKATKKTALHADPADGFLAALLDSPLS
jgi:hypothetical protein